MIDKTNTPPPTEVRLKELQAEYLKPDCPREIQEEYFMLLRTYARSITLGLLKKKNTYLAPEKVDEIATDSALATLSQYEKEGWEVKLSFKGQLYYKILEVLYGPAEEEKVFSLNNTFTEDKDSKEIMDTLSMGAMVPWEPGKDASESNNPADLVMENINVAYDEIESIINEAYNDLPYRVYLRFLPWLLLQIRKPKTRNIYQLFNKHFLTNKEENAFNILLLEIRNRIAKHM